MNPALALLEMSLEAERHTDEAERLKNEIASQLAPHITRYEELDPPGCGSTGGWDFQEIAIEEGVPVVKLEHRCFYAHRYDCDDRYYVSVPLEKLLDTHWRPKVR